jgi:hypothetical protein
VLQGMAKFNGNCSLLYVGRPLSFMSAGFAVAQDSNVKCTSLLHQVLDIHFKNMVREGFVDSAWAEHVTRARNMPGAGGTVVCADSRRRARGHPGPWGVVGGGGGGGHTAGGKVLLQGDGRRKGSGGAGGSGEAPAELAVSSNVDRKTLTLSDMGGTHATYLLFMCIALFCWTFSTETPQGRKFIVPCLHRKAHSVTPHDLEALEAGTGAEAAADTPIARLELKMESLHRKVERLADDLARLLQVMDVQGGGVAGAAGDSSRLRKVKGALDGAASDLQIANL